MTAEARVYVRERAHGTFELRAYLGVKSDGRSKFRHETHKGDERSAQARAREIEAAMLRGELGGELPADTIGAFIDRYLARIEASGDNALSTIMGYKVCRKRLPDRMARMSLAKIAPREFERLYLELIEKGLSPVTVTNTHRFFHLALEYAVEIGEVAKNPLAKLRPPKGQKRTSRVVSLDDDFDLDGEEGRVATIPRDQVFAIVDSFDRPSGFLHRNPMLHALFYLAYATGMRRGELLGLSWKLIDLEAGKLHVRRSLFWPHPVVNPIIKEPKTESGRRTITISPATVAKLKEWRGRLTELAKEAKRPVPPFVFPDLGTLGPYRPDTATNAFRSRAASLGYKGSMHMLRHTHASELLSAREPLHVVSKRLGHADVATTLRIYAHAIPGSDESVASRIDEVLGL